VKTPGLVVHPEAVALLDTFLVAPVHALLISGSRGTGKTILARQLGTELLGTQTLENQPYYREVVPVKGTTTIAQIRELIQFFRLAVPGKQAIKRVAVLQDAEAMGTEAQNALLKLLEEPPEGSVLLLTSSNVQSLLPTIRSRVQLVMLPKPSEAALLEHFHALGHDETTVQRAILRHGDNLADVHTALEQGSTAEDTAVNLVRQVLGGNTYERLLSVDGILKQKDTVREFVETLAQVAAVSIDTAASKQGNVQRWYTVLQAAQVAGVALEHSGNTKLVLTELMLSL
jgi:DNA polymerase III gamma/tau subunit